jgi:amino acid adenylation domain-containing protein
MLFHHPFEQNVERVPEKFALICDGHRLAYAELEVCANSMAHAMRANGLLAGDRVAICLDNSPEAIVASLAVSKAGGVFVILSPLVKSKKLTFILNDCQARFLVTSLSMAAELERLPPELRAVIVKDDAAMTSTRSLPVVNWKDFVSGAPTQPLLVRRIDLDLCSIFYTSGSTGAPKGVMLTHLNMNSAATSITQYLELSSSDITLNFSPLSTDYGYYNVALSLRAGATSVCEKAFVYPGQLVQLLDRERVSGLALVPTIIAILLKFKQLRRNDLSGVRYITTTGQSLPPSHLIEMQELFPQARLYSMYGLTECKRVSYLDPKQVHVRPSSVGKAMPNTEVYLIDAEGKRVDEQGREGELVVRGSNVMKGYWRRTEETAARLRDGENENEKVLHTGDLFRMDAEGYLYFVARKDDIFKTGGHLVSPKEIENVLHELPDVVEAVVIPVPDEMLGNAVKALIAVTLQATLTEEQITNHCREHLEPFMVPKHVEFCQRLPKTLAGKTDRRSHTLQESGE